MKRTQKPDRNDRMRLRIQQLMPEIYMRTGLRNDGVARALGISESTFWRKKNDPLELTLCDLLRMSELAGKNFSDFLAEFVK